MWQEIEERARRAKDINAQNRLRVLAENQQVPQPDAPSLPHLSTSSPALHLLASYLLASSSPA